MFKQDIFLFPQNEQHKYGGELSGSRKEINKYNKIMIEKYWNGVSVDKIAEEYCLSIYAIRKIIYQKMPNQMGKSTIVCPRQFFLLSLLPIASLDGAAHL